VNGDDPSVRNTFERPDAVIVQHRQITPGSAGLELTLPAHSVTVVRLEL
jgi:alpha-L-arabinofuranosidase